MSLAYSYRSSSRIVCTNGGGIWWSSSKLNLWNILHRLLLRQVKTYSNCHNSTALVVTVSAHLCGARGTLGSVLSANDLLRAYADFVEGQSFIQSRSTSKAATPTRQRMSPISCPTNSTAATNDNTPSANITTCRMRIFYSPFRFDNFHI
jgi:hypothetical protein